ncbi:metallopeptidase family M24 [Saitoella complicata NRRL Y-17804]|uniref:metallopeptidase family M24 n=1 Tax=Saitoella complicata (strain BCRC 22490 / CBS 7301 / JCM 7358 / NBRC 10748 / NRRL Y-17804) TaxID=698492 RepID=UPI000867E6C2|nr:metallopeptidase family M24 [Saitoella complicata NRRL Y-17804]ODQ53899.1 metallopeptidase family M24 [Saitoella complicata NRRL Y-17804]
MATARSLPRVWPSSLQLAAITRQTVARTQRSKPYARTFGQPTAYSHPHLVKANELTRGITPQEYAARRAALADRMVEGSIAICVGNHLHYMSGSAHYDFQQNANFFYLSGFTEPDAVLVIEKVSALQHQFHLFVPPKDEFAELWNGTRTGVDAALEVFGADEAWSINSLVQHLTPMVDRATVIYGDFASLQRQRSSLAGAGFLRGSTSSQAESLITSMLDPVKLKPLNTHVHSLRSFKSPAEIALMRTAGKISGRGFNNTMQKRLMSEHEVATTLDYEFKMGGCEKSAYVPVVAGGEHALTIHYTSNNDMLESGEMILVDAGGQYGGYAADITRTWPVNGKFTPAQRDLYQAVLNVNKSCIKLVSEAENMTMNDLLRKCSSQLGEQLKALGFSLVEGDLDRVLFPHHVSHQLGIQVHDSPSIHSRDVLKAGQVITIEPAIYVPNNERWPKHFRGMGIRVEDDVLVGKTDPVVLTTEAAKEVVDIEELMR